MIAVLGVMALLPLYVHGEALFEGAATAVEARAVATVTFARQPAALNALGYRLAGRVAQMPVLVRRVMPGAKREVPAAPLGAPEVVSVDVAGSTDFSVEVRDGQPDGAGQRRATDTATVVITF